MNTCVNTCVQVLSEHKREHKHEHGPACETFTDVQIWILEHLASKHTGAGDASRCLEKNRVLAAAMA